MSEPRRGGGRIAQQATTSGPPKPATPADSAMPAEPAKRAKSHLSGEADGDWRVPPDQTAGHGSDLLDAPAALPGGEGAQEIIPLLLLEAAQGLLAGAPPGAGQAGRSSGHH